MLTLTIEFINENIIIAQQIQNMTYTDNIIQEVCNIDTNLYNKELNGLGNKSLEKTCHQVAYLQQKSFSSKWTNAVMRKFIRASITNPSNLRTYIVLQTLNPRLKNCGTSSLNLTTQ